MLNRQLQKSLLKESYIRKLILGAVLGVAIVIVVLSLFGNYRRAVELHLTGIHPHLSIRRHALSIEDMTKIEVALDMLGDAVVSYSPAIDLKVNTHISQADVTNVTCADRDGQSRIFDFNDAAAMVGWKSRDAKGFAVERSRTGPIRLRGISVDDQGKTLTDVERVLDVRTAHDDLIKLERKTSARLPPMVLFERNFFHGAGPLDDFLISPRLPGAAQHHHVRLLSPINLGLKSGQNPVVLMSLEQAQHLLGRPGFTNTVDVRLRNPDQAVLWADFLSTRLKNTGLEVRSWRDEDAGAFRLLGVLGRVLSLVLVSVVLIAALSIASTLSLVVVERRRTIAMLRALGLRDRGIFNAVMIGAVRIAGMGLAGGVGLGLIASAALLEVPGFRSALGKMGVGQPEVLLQPSQLAVLALATLVLFIAAAWAPARAACRVDPVAGLTS